MKSYKKMVSLFIIMLVLTIPFISASNMQIITNTGNQGVDRFINANGDTWVVEVLLSHVNKDSVSPENLFMKVGNNQQNFDSCTESPEGIICKYISPLPNGISEGEYQFTTSYVFYEDVTENKVEISDSNVIRADGTAPKINNFEVRQREGKIHVKFSVTDKIDGPAVGIDHIEILEGDTNEVLEQIEVNDISYDKEGYLNVVFDGEGRRKLKLRVTDLLGNQVVSVPHFFNTDFVKPVIKASTFETTLGRFIGMGSTESDIWIDVEEKNLKRVYAESEQIRFGATSDAQCHPNEEELNLYHCVWRNVRIIPTETLQFKVIAVDNYDNVAEQMLTQSFVVDREGPKILYFGSANQYEGVNYVGATEQHIELKVTDQGSGVNVDKISLNLGALGSDGRPDECVEDGEVVTCYWSLYNRFASSRIVNLGIRSLEDMTGNDGQRQDIEVYVDSNGPKVNYMSFHGISDVKKDYFQSNDIIFGEIEVAESTGVKILVNMNYLATDAETKWPETRYKEAGWQEFDDCYRMENDVYSCVIETGKIKSGPDRRVPLEIKVLNTAGNNADVWPENVRNVEGSNGRYFIDIRGLDNEPSPDYWTLRRSVPLTDFIDVDTTPLTFTRMPLRLEFTSANSRARMLNIEVLNCVAEESGIELPTTFVATENETAPEPEMLEGPEVSRSLIYGGNTPEGVTSPKPNLVIEFAPFDGKEYFTKGKGGFEEDFTYGHVKVNCTVAIYSEVSNNALAFPEIKTINIDVPFAFTELGAIDANLDAKIKEARDAAGGFWTFISHLNSLLRWATWLVRIVTILVNLIQIFENIKPAFDGLRATPWTKLAADSSCWGFNSGSQGVSTAMNKYVMPVNAVLSCTYPSGLQWYDNWVRGVLGWYTHTTLNLERMHSPATDPEAYGFKGAVSLKDNLFLSAVGLCLPGLIENFEVMRQILCRKVICLEQDVVANRATVEQCDQLQKLLFCKYVVGQAWGLVPFKGLWDGIFEVLRSVTRGPINLMMQTLMMGCGVWCMVSSGMSGLCNFIHWLLSMVDFVQNMAGFVYQSIEHFSFGKGNDYCNQVGLGPGW